VRRPDPLGLLTIRQIYSCFLLKLYIEEVLPAV